jgi:ribonuclease J
MVTVAVGKGTIGVAGLGLPLDEDYEDFCAEARDDVADALAKLKGKSGHDRDKRIEAVRLAARRAAQRWSGKKPQVQVLMLDDKG